MLFKKFSCVIPADVPDCAEADFIKNYSTITKKSNNLFLFACDQKIEHLNKDFYGHGIHPDALNPEHVFKIAHAGYVGACALPLGLISRYGSQYPSIPYIAKLNGKTDLIPKDVKDPVSYQLWQVADVIKMKTESDINICGVGYTLYPGSSYEGDMMAHAARIITQAHEHGLVAIIWVYARGKSITDDQDPQLIAGIAGLAASLGADFVKTKPPHDAEGKTSAQWLAIATAAAGNSRVICAGGEKLEAENFFATLEQQMKIGNTAGCATGRNIFQRSLPEAIAMTKAISALVYDHKDAAAALKIFQARKQ